MSSPTPHRFGYPVWDLRDVLGWVLDRDANQFGRIYSTDDAASAIRIAAFYKTGAHPVRDQNALRTILHALQSGKLSAHEGETVLPREHWGARNEIDLRSALARGLWFYREDVLRLWPVEADLPAAGTQHLLSGGDPLRAPKWTVWKHIPKVKTFAAVALSLNIDPNKIRHSAHSWMVDKRLFDESQEFKDRLFVVEGNLEAIGLQNPREFRYLDHDPEIRLDRFANWARRIGWTLPPELLELSLDLIQSAAADTEQQAQPKPSGREDAQRPQNFYKRDALKYWLRGRYRDGVPPDISNKEIARQFESDTKIAVNEKTVRRARGSE